jgi:hypothetical protein
VQCGTAGAISDHYLLTAAHCPPAMDADANYMFTHTVLEANHSIRVCHEINDDVDRQDMYNDTSSDDPIATIHQYADGHDPKTIYVVDNPTGGAKSELDITLLYSPVSLGHSQHPLPARSRPCDAPYTLVSISLLAYNVGGTIDVARDYPYTDQRLFDAFGKIEPDRLTLTSATTGVRNVPGLRYHRCSSTGGALGGPLVNVNMGK